MHQKLQFGKRRKLSKLSRKSATYLRRAPYPPWKQWYLYGRKFVKTKLSVIFLVTFLHCPCVNSSLRFAHTPILFLIRLQSLYNMDASTWWSWCTKMTLTQSSNEKYIQHFLTMRITATSKITRFEEPQADQFEWKSCHLIVGHWC